MIGKRPELYYAESDSGEMAQHFDFKWQGVCEGL
jgi:hypothetical protein